MSQADDAVKQPGWRSRLAERQMLKGKWQPALVKRAGGPVTIAFGRTGVYPAGGWLLLLPVWLFIRLRWQIGDQTWTVRACTAGRFRSVMTRTLDERRFNSKEEARAGAQAMLRHARSGFYDEQLGGAQRPA